jgi:hypothetical protein
MFRWLHPPPTLEDQTPLRQQRSPSIRVDQFAGFRSSRFLRIRNHNTYYIASNVSHAYARRIITALTGESDVTSVM